MQNEQHIDVPVVIIADRKSNPQRFKIWSQNLSCRLYYLEGPSLYHTAVIRNEKSEDYFDEEIVEHPDRKMPDTGDFLFDLQYPQQGFTLKPEKDINGLDFVILRFDLQRKGLLVEIPAQAPVSVIAHNEDLHRPLLHYRSRTEDWIAKQEGLDGLKDSENIIWLHSPQSILRHEYSIVYRSPR